MLNFNRSSPGSAGNRQKKLIPLILVFVLVLLSIPFSPFEKSSVDTAEGERMPGFMEVFADDTTPPSITVNQPTYSSSSGYASVSGYVSVDGLTINSAGFIWAANYVPAEGSYTGSVLSSVVSGGGSFSATFYPSVNSTIYVKAYVVASDSKTYYSTNYYSVYTGSSSSSSSSSSTNNSSNVRINNIYNLDYYTANVEFYTSYSANSCGVVYSRYDSYPEVGNSEGTVYSGSSSGYHTVRLTNLYSNGRYYARAFVYNGSSYEYSSAKSFYANDGYYSGSSSTYRSASDGTSNNSFISTTNVSDVTETTATAYGEVGSYSSYSSSDPYYYNSYYYNGYYNDDYYYYGNSYYYDNYYNNGYYYNDGYYNNGYYYNDGNYYNRDYYNYERGFVYSTTATAPTVSDSKVSESNTSSGTYSYKLTDLTPNTKYYVRAYVRNGYGTYYGAALNFTTLPSSSGSVSSTSSSSGSGSTAYSTQKPYMTQISSRTFAPNTSIMRVDIAKMIYAITNGESVESSSSFSDIPSGHIAKTEIDYAVSKGYMQGYPDGTFKPNSYITRAEISTVLCVVFDITPESSGAQFSDVSTHWAKPYITAAANAGIITGYPGSIFRPDENTTRAEACVMFARASKRTTEPLGSTTFYDVPSTHWAYRYIMNAALAQ